MPGHIRQHTLCMFVAWSIAQLSDHSAVTAAGDTAPLLSWQRICAGCWQRGYAGCRERGHDQGHSSGERADRVHLVTLSSPRPQVVVACSQRAPQSHSWRVLSTCASPRVLNYEQSCLTPAAGLREKQAPQQAPQRRLRASCRAGRNRRAWNKERVLELGRKHLQRLTEGRLQPHTLQSLHCLHCPSPKIVLSGTSPGRFADATRPCTRQRHWPTREH